MRRLTTLLLMAAGLAAVAPSQDSAPHPVWIRRAKTAAPSLTKVADSNTPAAERAPAIAGGPSSPDSPAALTWQGADHLLVGALTRNDCCAARDAAARARTLILASIASERATRKEYAATLGKDMQTLQRMISDRQKRVQVQQDELKRIEDRLHATNERLDQLNNPAVEGRLTPEIRQQIQAIEDRQVKATEEMQRTVGDELTHLKPDIHALETHYMLAQAYQGYWLLLADLSERREGLFNAHYQRIEDQQGYECARKTEIKLRPAAADSQVQQPPSMRLLQKGNQ